MRNTALVTGATGFLGSRLVATLVEQGWTVRACGRRPRPPDLPDSVDYRVVDLAGETPLAALADGVTHLFHLAGASSSTSTEEGMHRDNVVATQRLLAAFPAGQLARLVHMSSTSVYGEEVALPVPVREDVEPNPSRGYGKAKWRTEEVIWRRAAEGWPVVVLRPVSVYGPGNVKLLGSVVLDVAMEAYGGNRVLPVPSSPVEQRLLHIDDLMRASLHVATSEAAAGRAFNVVADRYPTSLEVAALVADRFAMAVELDDDPDCGPSYEQRRQIHTDMVAAGMRPDILLTTERFRFLRKANRNNRLSTDALVATGFRFTETDLDAAIGRTIDWYRRRCWVL
ncbi:MAG: NAD-dependent epimerase/dehydratase family protein [Acidimicrobiales bacterium]